MTKQTDIIKIRINSEIKEKIEIIAKSEQRTFAGQVRLVLQEWINQRGASCAKTIRAKKEPVEKLTKAYNSASMSLETARIAQPL